MLRLKPAELRRRELERAARATELERGERGERTSWGS